jgi:cytochrome c oxidase subunit 2
MILVVPFVVVLALESAAVRTIDVKLSQSGFTPERIEVGVGERVRLNVESVDGTHGFQVTGLGLDAEAPADGKAVTIDLTPKEAGTFTIRCTTYCGGGHDRTAALIVTPGM